jgi:hypothetical protein
MRILLLLLACLVLNQANAQELVFEVGGNSTEYQYQNLNGALVDYLKPATGLHVQLKRENVLWKVSKMFGAFDKDDNPLYVPTIKYAFGFTYNQYNSVGNTQGIALSYQTDHLGIIGEMGPEIPINQAISLDIKGIVSVAKMWNGNQYIANQYMPLDDQPQFSKIRIYGGYSISLVHHLSKFVSGFVKYQYLSSVKEPDYPVNHLRIIPTSFSLGVKINP